jgi:hypothetical protein
MIIPCLSKIINIYFKILFKIVCFLDREAWGKIMQFFSLTIVLSHFSERKQSRTKGHNVKTDDTEANETKWSRYPSFPNVLLRAGLDPLPTKWKGGQDDSCYLSLQIMKIRQVVSVRTMHCKVASLWHLPYRTSCSISSVRSPRLFSVNIVDHYFLFNGKSR